MIHKYKTLLPGTEKESTDKVSGIYFSHLHRRFLNSEEASVEHLLIYLLCSSEADVASQKISFIFYCNINSRA